MKTYNESYNKAKTEISLQSLQYWAYQLSCNRSNINGVISEINEKLKRGMRDYDLTKSVNILLNADPEYLEWLCRNNKEDVKKLIKKLEDAKNIGDID